MKTRNGFVSNSSSSSFVIHKKYLSPYQIEQIKSYEQTAKETKCGYNLDDLWSVYENEDTVQGDTIMDNFDMGLFLKTMGVNKDFIKWEY